MKNLILLAVCGAFLLGGCDKKSEDTPQDSPSVIQITSPTTGPLYINGGTLEIRGNVADNNGLKSVKLEVKNSSGGGAFYTNEIMTGSVLYYVINTDWTITGITSPTPCILTVTAKDYNDKIISKSISITLSD